MPKQSKSDRLKEVFDRAMPRMNECVSATSDQREQSLEDRRFCNIPGAQWEGVLAEQFAKRPMLEINKVNLSVLRIINNYRNNRIDAAFTSKKGAESEELAETCAGLYRADQEDSSADEAFDNAFEEGVGGGMGAWRLTAQYEDEYDEASEEQRIRFEPIYDADCTVYFDPSAKKYDKSDARFCFVITGMSHEAYEEEYGEPEASFERPVTDDGFDWSTTDLAYVGEYFEVAEKKVKVSKFLTFDGKVELHNDDDLTEGEIAKMSDIGTRRVSTKTVRKRVVRKYILSGDGVLEDCGEIAGRYIPIIPFYGKRGFVNGTEWFAGHVRLAKDPSRLYNMELSVFAEQAAEGGTRTPIFTPEQINGHGEDWASKSVKRPAYLLVNAILGPEGNETPMGPIGYSEPAEVPQALIALMELAGRDIKEILGNQEGGDEIKSNISGEVVEAVQTRLDMQSYIYISNFAKSIRHSAKVWLSMAGELYDEEERTMKSVDEQGSADFIDIGRKVIDEDGRPVREVDIGKAQFDVSVEIGPASSSRRQATVRALTEMLPHVTDPMDQAVVTTAILRNQEGEGMGPVREYFRKKLVSMGVEEPTDADLAEAQKKAENRQPGPQENYMAAAADNERAQAMESMADAEEAMASAEEKRAKAAATLASIPREDRRAAAEEGEKIIAQVRSGTGTLTQMPRQPQGPRP